MALREQFALASVLLREISYEEDQATSPAEAAEADGPHAEHADAKTVGRNQMGQSALALRLQSPRLGMGARSLEQIVDKGQKQEFGPLSTSMLCCHDPMELNSKEIPRRGILAN